MRLNRKFSADNIWFTSDLHLGHANIIKYSNRPFQNYWEMDKALIDNWNNMISERDIIFHLGDFSLHRDLEEARLCLDVLKGEKYFVRGNHEKNLERLTSSIYDMLEIKVEDGTVEGGYRPVVLCHYAMRVWNKSHHGAYHLYGHSHGTLPDDPNSLSIDVGVDCFDYKPVSFRQIQEIMSRKQWVPVDHHKEGVD